MLNASRTSAEFAGFAASRWVDAGKASNDSEVKGKIEEWGRPVRRPPGQLLAPLFATSASTNLRPG